MQTFSKLREGGYVYVDKTEYIHRLVTTGEFFFLSRPRRFGKSLLLSTLEAYFSGHKHLFEGLAIYNHTHNWESHPVLHIDLTGRNYKDKSSLNAHFDEHLRGWEALYEVTETDYALEERFRNVIKKAYHATGKKVVILIDEYDKPLLDAVDNDILQDFYRNDLKAIYGNLKKMDPYIRFAMITGVTKFGKLSIFSDLNNLKDISLRKDFSCICGMTLNEIKQYFNLGVEEFADATGITPNEAYALLKTNYDGYHFAPDAPDIYNPFSMLNALDSHKIDNYWFSTGTPTFLVEMIKRSRIELKDLTGAEVGLSELTDVSLDLSKLNALLYQSGYLTIKGYDPFFDSVTLGYPNKEVEYGFLKSLMDVYTPSVNGKSEFNVYKFVRDVEAGNIDEFMTRLQSLFAGYQYDQFELGNLEMHYQNVLYLVMKLMGFYTQAEMRTASGRIDLVIKTDRYIYLFEFKIDSSAEKALSQINEKEYTLPFKSDGRTIVKVGANFSTQTRSINEWVSEYAG